MLHTSTSLVSCSVELTRLSFVDPSVQACGILDSFCMCSGFIVGVDSRLTVSSGKFNDCMLFCCKGHNFFFSTVLTVDRVTLSDDSVTGVQLCLHVVRLDFLGHWVAKCFACKSNFLPKVEKCF